MGEKELKNFDYLQLNLIQHYRFCSRQCALIFLEKVWLENVDTVIGSYVHQNVDDKFFDEKRENKMIVRSMPLRSERMKLIGIADVVEFTKSKNGVRVRNYSGLWKPYVVQYKKGKPKKEDCDIMQLVAEVMAVEEMFQTRIEKSALYYKTTNKRVVVEIDEELREKAKECVRKMHEMIGEKKTPPAKIGKNCNRCSLKEKCMPRLTHHKKSVTHYLQRHYDEMDEEGEEV